MMNGCLIDTSVLVRLANPHDQLHSQAVEAVRQLQQEHLMPYLTPQIMAEFWNVATRPVEANGLGWDIEDVANYVFALLENVYLLFDSEQSFYVWLYLVRTRGVRGKQVHDARLVATMLTHGVDYLLTFNGDDFRRYADIIAIIDANTP
jgi:predicted nucleic acid-binding protein